jgi:hypothetical protein
VDAPAGELVWMRQPPVADPLAPAALPWAEATLVQGSWSPDVLFSAPASLRGDSDAQLFATSFFTGGGLTMLECARCSGGGGTWATAALSPVVIDATLGPSFDVAVVDVNGDGLLDVLVTNHVDNATNSSLVSVVAAYEPPRDVATPLSDVSAWTKHILADGFFVREPGPNQAAPGAARAFAPPAGATEGTRPWVSVSGDGDQRLYVLTPGSPSPDDWQYVQNLVWDCKGTVGRQVSITVGGALFLAVPCYDSGRIEVVMLE